jgi:hypothetical protein
MDYNIQMLLKVICDVQTRPPRIDFHYVQGQKPERLLGVMSSAHCSLDLLEQRFLPYRLHFTRSSEIKSRHTF